MPFSGPTILEWPVDLLSVAFFLVHVNWYTFLHVRKNTALTILNVMCHHSTFSLAGSRCGMCAPQLLCATVSFNPWHLFYFSFVYDKQLFYSTELPYGIYFLLLCGFLCFCPIISKCMNKQSVNIAHLKRWLVSDKNIEPHLCQSVKWRKY